MDSKCAKCHRQSERFSEFTQIVSHDLQSPVNKIISFLDLFKNQLGENLDSKSAEYLERINKNAAVLTLLMKKLRDYAHASSVTETPAPTDLNRVLKSVKENLQLEMRRTDAQILSDPLPIITGRSAQLTTLWQNLLHNALVHRGDRAPVIQLRTKEHPSHWEFSVEDNGPGVKRENYEKIFQIFPRLENQDSPSTGIGLAIAKKIVENHDGKIWIQSDPPRGSTIFFTLSRH